MRMLLFLLVPTLAAAGPVRDHHVVAELVPVVDAIVPGKTFTVCLNIKHDDKWHTYWKNPGIAGVPIQLKWDLPDGFKAGPIQWARPQRVKMAIYNTFGYEGDVSLLVDITAPSDLKTGSKIELKTTTTWMMCADACYPSSAKLSLEMPVADKAKPDPRGTKLAATTRKMMPVKNTRWKTSATLGEKTGTLTLTRTKGAKDEPEPDKLYLFSDNGLIDSHQEQEMKRVAPGVFQISLPRAEFGPKDPKAVTGVLFETIGKETKALSIRAKLRPQSGQSK